MTGVQTCALPICFPVTIRTEAAAETMEQLKQMQQTEQPKPAEEEEKEEVKENEPKQ